MMKIVVRLEFEDQKTKQKVMKTVSGLSGVESIALDPNDKKLTVIGDVDPVAVMGRLRKLCRGDISSVGPAKEPEKVKEKPNTEADKKMVGPKVDLAQLLNDFHQRTAVGTPYYYYRSVEEDPNSCVIF